MIPLFKWKNLGLARQLGNIGSEIARAKHWDDQRDDSSREQAVFRALDLIDLTIRSYPQLTRRRELCRFRETLCNWYLREKTYEIDVSDLETYCLALISLEKDKQC